MTRRARVATVAVAVIAIGSAVAVGAGIGGAGPPSRHDAAPTTTAVTRQTLVDYIDATGELGYGEPVPLRYTALATDAADPTAPGSGAGGPSADEQHLITWLPAAGTTVGRGQALFRIDDRPVTLLFGALPVYRTLKVGVVGADVMQLEQNLAALGYRGFTVDRSFTASTRSAVRRWQRDLGLAISGVISPGQVTYSPDAIRIAATTVRVGDPASGEILDYTGTTRKVTMQLPADEQRYAGEGAALTVTLPDGGTVTGTVDLVAPAPAGDTGPAVTVIVAIADQAALGPSTQGPVRVRFAADRHPDVLTVPVVALVALAEGGYGVQVVAGTTTRYLAVTTGMFAGGLVEVTAGDLRPGMMVVVPA